MKPTSRPPKSVVNRLPDLSESPYRGWCLLKNIPIDKKMFNSKCRPWHNCKHFVHRKWTKGGKGWIGGDA
jgi:hypothetical protein